MITAVASLTALGLSIGFVLGIAGKKLKVKSDPLVDEIEAMLPGSQCGQCGYPGCKPAAKAVVEGEIAVTFCPPGGQALVERLAAKLGVEVNLSDYSDSPDMIARVQDDLCVGCTRCFKVCPTDAIIGGPKMIHGVFTKACTGCAACEEICPTEAIRLYEIPQTLSTWRWPKPGRQRPLTSDEPVAA
jgi:electron transport complex protein RnfB